MSIGMTYEQFWYGDPWMVVSFRKAHELRNEMLNQQLWLQGLYIHNAVDAVISTALNKRKTYIEKPIDINECTSAEKEKEKAIKFFQALEAAWMQKGATDGGRRDSS